MKSPWLLFKRSLLVLITVNLKRISLASILKWSYSFSSKFIIAEPALHNSRHLVCLHAFLNCYRSFNNTILNVKELVDLSLDIETRRERTPSITLNLKVCFKTKFVNKKVNDKSFSFFSTQFPNISVFKIRQ